MVTQPMHWLVRHKLFVLTRRTLVMQSILMWIQLNTNVHMLTVNTWILNTDDSAFSTYHLFISLSTEPMLKTKRKGYQNQNARCLVQNQNQKSKRLKHVKTVNLHLRSAKHSGSLQHPHTAVRQQPVIRKPTDPRHSTGATSSTLSQPAQLNLGHP